MNADVFFRGKLHSIRLETEPRFVPSFFLLADKVQL